jgi:hypothetical protein
VEHSTNGDRRRNRRWQVGGRLAARVEEIPQASLVDVSLAGALLEHTKTIKPGTISFLTLSVNGHRAVLRCRVVRSMDHRCEIHRTGARDLLYRTGLEFLTPSEASLGLILLSLLQPRLH